MGKFWGIENVMKFEKIAYNASWRNFIFAIFSEMSFSTATGDSTSLRLPFAFLGVNERYGDFASIEAGHSLGTRL